MEPTGAAVAAPHRSQASPEICSPAGTPPLSALLLLPPPLFLPAPFSPALFRGPVARRGRRGVPGRAVGTRLLDRIPQRPVRY